MQRAHKSSDLAPDERTVVERLLGRPLQSDETIEVVTSVGPAKSSRDARPIWEVITERMNAVPSEVFDRLPNDGASEHDHYLLRLAEEKPVKVLFADTFYWIALINRKDSAHQRVLDFGRSFGSGMLAGVPHVLSGFVAKF
jgi:hypothetical protein